MRYRLCIVLLPALAHLVACGGRGGLPPDRPPMVKGPDGKQYYVVERGSYKAFYDAWGQLARLENDSNGDGKPDRISVHAGQKNPVYVEIDEDLDGRMDRWEYYTEAGRLEKVGATRKGRSVPDVWSYTDANGEPTRREYDDDGDGRPERAELLLNGLVVRVEIDANRDGRADRWQEWDKGRMLVEDLDTDADGTPDRRIRYDERGKVSGLERLAP